MIPDSMSQWWIRNSPARGLSDVRWHDLRHWSASRLIAAGTDVRTVASRLGHASPKTTLGTYAHLFEAQRRAAGDAAAEGL